jgi:hypothetical protein
MSTPYLIPLAGVPETFGITLGGTTYTFTLAWRNAPCNPGWFLDIGDANNNPIIRGLPMVTGADLLAQYGYLGFGGSLYVQTVQNPDATPTFTNLGTDCNLYWVAD